MSVEDRFRHIVGDELNVDSDRITTQAGLIDDLCADSLDLVSLVIEAEREFGVMISDADWEQIITFGDAVKLITRHMRAAA